MIGTNIGKYEIKSEIGRGGMGIVYLGYQTSLDRKVAIKVLPPQLANDKDSVTRFIQEANLIAKLNHDNIVRIYDIEERDSAYYIIMEFLEGASLDQIVRNKTIEVTREDMIDFIIQACQALECTHKHGIIHRDVKAANIFITKEKRVKLMDFGISKMTTSTMTTGMALGTPSYMSPEQAKGQHLDAGTDIYSLGVVLYECLTGRLPFIGEDAFSIALKQINDPVTPPYELDPAIPSNFNKCCLTALEKDRTKRFKTCDDLAQALKGNWPSYIDQKITIIEKTKNYVDDIFSNKVFLPGITIISLLMSFMLTQQIFIKYPDKIFKHDKGAIAPTSKSKLKPNTKTKPLTENLQTNPQNITNSQTTPVTIKTEDLDRIDMSIEVNHFKKAQSLIDKLKKDFPENEKLILKEEKLKIKKQKYELLNVINNSLKNGDPKTALNKINLLCSLHPNDEILKQQQQSIKNELEKFKVKKDIFAKLLTIKENKKYDTLLKETNNFLKDYPNDKEGLNLLNFAREKMQEIEKNKQTEFAIEQAKVYMNNENLKTALEIIQSRIKN